MQGDIPSYSYGLRVHYYRRVQGFIRQQCAGDMLPESNEREETKMKRKNVVGKVKTPTMWHDEALETLEQKIEEMNEQHEKPLVLTVEEKQKRVDWFAESLYNAYQEEFDALEEYLDIKFSQQEETK